MMKTLEQIAAEVKTLKSGPASSDEYHGGYQDGRNDALSIVDEVIDSRPHGDTCPYCKGTGRIEATMAVRLTALRQIKGVTQDEVADAARVSRSQIANLERGRGEPSISSLMLLASYFEVSTDYLLGVSS